MNELLGLAAALASLVALACWARTVPTRAWGDDTPTGAARWRAKAVALGTLLLQTTTASLAAGWVAGVAGGTGPGRMCAGAGGLRIGRGPAALSGRRRALHRDLTGPTGHTQRPSAHILLKMRSSATDSCLNSYQIDSN